VSPPLLTSPLLVGVAGIVHGFTTREGGDSLGPFDALNLSTRVGDERALVEVNRRRVLEAVGSPGATFVTLRQVHGDSVVEVSHLAGRSIEADGLWTRDRMAVLGVLVADCVPILIADGEGRGVAAVHAGWRGTRAKVVTRMVARLKAAGLAPAGLVAALGPAIGPCCFQIGEDVADELRLAFPHAGEAIRVGTDGRTNADLWALNRLTLVEAGLAPERIDTLRTCTSCSQTLFSHRRDGGHTGRQAGVIGLLPT
jgi:YfiH family protein